VLKVYYDRNTITVSFDTNGGVGTVAPKAGKYESEITLPTDTDVTKDGHILSGWKDAQGVLYPVGSKFTLKEGVTLTAYWTEEATEVASYTVEYYHQNINDDDYTKVDSYTIEGKTVGTTVTATIKAFPGFTHNAGISNATGEVLAGNALVLKVYYDRNTITVSFDTNGGVGTVAPKAGKYESEITLPTETDVTKDGHILSGWEDVHGVIYPAGGVFTLKEDTNLTAFWTEETVVVPVSGVVIETYLLNIGATNDDTANYTLFKSVYVGNVSVGENIQIVPSSITGFEFNQTHSIVSGTVTENINITLKLYYDRNVHNVAFAVNGGTDVASTTVQFGGTINLPGEDSTQNPGKVLAGWEFGGTTYAPGSEFTLTDDTDVTLNAVWADAPQKYAGFKVEHYQLKVGGTNGAVSDYELIETETVENVLVGSQATATAKTYTGFVTNTSMTNEMSGIVAQDGSLVLKVYYDRIVLDITFDENGGTPDMTDATYQYGATITFPGDTNFTKEGYELVGWQAPDGTIYPAGYTLTIDFETDTEYVAYWKLEEFETSSYTVHHYKIIPGGTSGDFEDYELVETEVFNGIKVGTIVTAIAGEYRGYEVNEDLSELEGTVTEDEELILTVFYDIAVIDIIYEENGGTPDLNDISVQFGESFKLPDETDISRYGYYLYKWYGSNGVIYDPGAVVNVDFTHDITFTANWVPLGQYAYVTEYYRQSVDGASYELYDTSDEQFGYEGETVTVDIASIPEYIGFTYDSENTGNVLSGEITENGLTLKVYYSRNKVKISFELNGGTALDSLTDSYEVFFGSEITLPEESSVEKEYAKLVKWVYNTEEYEPGATVIIETDPDGGYTFVAKWEDLVIYEVIFYDKWFLEVGNVIVIENETVDKPEFPDDKLYAVTGYKENEYISSNLYSGENEYVHEVYTDWYFEHPGTGEFIRFDETVPVSADIVVDGILEVFPMSPMLDIDIAFDLKGISESFNFSAFYEATVFDSDGNVIKGTRAMDTFKDILWANLNSESGEDSQIKAFARDYIDKALEKLAERALIDENHNIRLFDLFIKFSQIIGEEKLEEYIIDNAKKTLSQNDDLKGYIFDYFETIANSGSEEDIKELEGLLTETINGALEGNDSGNILSIIEELCVKMLDDPDMIENAIKNVAGIEIDVTQEDLSDNAKAVILSWANMLITDDMLDSVLKQVPYNKKSDGTYVYTSENISGVSTRDFIVNIIKNANFTLDDLDELGISRDELFSQVKASLIDKIIEKLENDETFFNKSVSYVFKDTPFEDFTKDKVSPLTVDFFRSVVEAYFESMTVEELAIELGYDDQDAINDFFRNHKEEVIDAIVYELDHDAEFFSHIISKTDFAGLVTYNDVMTLSVKELIAKVVGNKLDVMTGDDLASYDAVKSVIEDFDAICNELIERIETDDTFFNTVIASAFAGTLLDGYTLSSMPVNTLDFVKELVEKKINNLSDDELGELAGKVDAQGLIDFAKEEISKLIIDNLTNDTDGIYSDMIYELTGKTSSEIDAIASKDAFVLMLTKIVDDAKNTGNYDELKKFIGSESDIWDENDWEAFFMGFEYSIEDDDIVDEYLLNISYGKYTLDESGIDIDKYPDAQSIPGTSKEMFVGFIQANLDNNLDETLDEYGYDNAEILDEARKYAKDSVIEQLESDQQFLKDQIESMTGVTLATISPKSRTFIADVIEAKLQSLSEVNDEFAGILGFADLGSLLGDSMVKSMIREEVISRINTDDSFLAEQIREYTGISYTTIPDESHILFDDMVQNRIESVDSVDDTLADQLGFNSADELLEAAKPGVIEVIIEELDDDVENYKPFIEDYIGESFGEIPETSMEFIKKYARNVLNGMTEEQIREELRMMGYTDDDIDNFIEDEIVNVISNPSDELLVTLIKMVSEKYKNINDISEVPSNAKDFVTEEALYRLESDDATLREVLVEMFGYVPEELFTDPSYTTKDFLIDVVIYMFEHDETKRGSIIDQAVKELIEGGDLSALEDYVDYAVDYLDSQVNPDGTSKLDNVIDDIIESRYRATLDKLVYQLINEDTFEIDPSTSFILSAFEMQVKSYSFDELIKGVPEALFKIYPKEKLEEIYTRAYNDLLSQIEEGKVRNQNGETAIIDTGLTFMINPVDDIYSPLRDRAVEYISGIDKLNNNYYYAENKYLRELINLTEASNFVDSSATADSGYKLKDYNDYYDLILRAVIIGDDAFTWYTDQLSPEKLDALMLNYEELAVKYANAVAEMIEVYATDGQLPEKLDKDKVRAVESAITKRFPGLLDKVLDWYVESPINKEYTEDDYAKVRSAVQKVFKKLNITTDELFEIPGKVIVKLVDAFKEKDENVITKLDEILDNVAKTGNNEYAGTLKGITVTVKLDGDVYYITAKGKTVKVNLADGEYFVQFGEKSAVYNMDENLYKFSAGENNSVSVRRSIK
ncbi:MAG: InlB B-repeat-containing protein, partial [Clostridia bacterium]|nr:InlB B-repeat-containing protein [Clostridia bacterium]